MSKILSGCDMSHWQDDKLFDSVLKNDAFQFAIFKATQGRSYEDPTARKRIKQWLFRSASSLIGIYHFYDPKYSPKDNFNNFSEFIDAMFDELPGTTLMCVLDWEADALNEPIETARIFNTLFIQKYDKPIVFYTSEYYATHKGIDVLANYGCKLWCAKYSNTPPRAEKLGSWKECIMWQRSSSANGIKLDMNQFNGDVDMWNNLCISKPEKVSDNTDKGCFCGCSCCK